MVAVAVAGGTGDVGKTVVDQVPSATANSGVKFVAVDYDDVEETAKTLEAHRVDTIISALNIEGPSEQAQLKLIAAAEKSQVTRRFIPSEFAGETAPDDFTGPVLRAAKALAESRLTYARVANVMFMDYFGLPKHPEPSETFQLVPQRARAYSMLYSKDLARFLDRLINEPEWQEWSIISGADTCLNELVALAEKITGDKFHVTYDSVADLGKGKSTPMFDDSASYNGMDPAAISAWIGLSVAQGKMLLPKDGRLNEKFPDVQPKPIERFMTEAWSKQ
ncbi:hypothetical protein INS49_013279 [Diaporthe citri]|uniref:uncharacterized protein n=1 Tax=Diaporthe citri TaxID=83186 RepID=UPI001C825550|nr:uncharacterized protein INS49_013279 [Diaporthe citri]KAG6357402.1 hypothetical protein INS49_013279 [Diaporthe citri]